MNGTLYGVGIGPGDPELISVRGKRMLEKADLIHRAKSCDCSTKNGRIPPRGSEHCGTNHTAYP